MKWMACIITVFGMAFYMRIIRRDSCNLLGLYGLHVMDDIWMGCIDGCTGMSTGKGVWLCYGNVCSWLYLDLDLLGLRCTQK